MTCQLSQHLRGNWKHLSPPPPWSPVSAWVQPLRHHHQRWLRCRRLVWLSRNFDTVQCFPESGRTAWKKGGWTLRQDASRCVKMRQDASRCVKWANGQMAGDMPIWSWSFWLPFRCVNLIQPPPRGFTSQGAKEKIFEAVALLILRGA